MGVPRNQAEDRYQTDQALLAENLFLILRRADEILARPHWFFCEPTCASTSVMLAWEGRIPLGVLLELWRAGQLTLPCPGCDGRLRLYSVNGSPMSGTHNLRGACETCQQVFRKGVQETWRGYGHFNELYLPLKEGLDRAVSAPAADPVPLGSLIDILKGGPGQVVVLRGDTDEIAFRIAWDAPTLSSAQDRPLYSLDGSTVRDADGGACYVWDGQVLRATDGRALCELVREQQALSPQPVDPPATRVFLQEVEGPPLVEVTGNTVRELDGRVRYRFPEPIPGVYLMMLGINAVSA